MRTAMFVFCAACFILPFTAQAQADDQAEVKAIVDKAIKAIGGEAKLSKCKAATWRAKGTLYANEEIPFTAEWTVQGPRQNRVEGEAEANGQKIKVLYVVNGDKVWHKIADQDQDLPEDAKAEQQARAYVDWMTAMLPLQQKEFKLSLLGESKVGDRAAVGITVSSKDHRDLSLFFDKENGLLVKAETRVKDVDKGVEVGQEMIYGEFKEMDGVKRPTKVAWKRDGKRYVEMEISAFKAEEKAEDGLFAQP